MRSSSQSKRAPPLRYQNGLKDKTSFEFPRRLERKLAEYNASQNHFKRWLFEILSVAVSGFCMGAIITILAILKDRPLQAWPFGLTLGTFLAKVASAALIVPISEAIGQLKWYWFQGKSSRDAFDFEVFDKASRGAWGSVLLLIRTRGRSLAAFGAILTILLLAIDSFFQQVTELPQRWVLHGKGMVPRTVRYGPTSGEDFTNEVSFVSQDTALTAMANRYFYGNGTMETPFGNGTRPDMPVSCPTTKCVWPAYQTLGMCSQCVEVPQLLSHACLELRIDWTSMLKSNQSLYPTGKVCGYFLNVSSENPVLMSGYLVDDYGKPTNETLIMRTLPLVTNGLRELLWDGSINYRHERYPIEDFLIAAVANESQAHQNIAPTIHECVITWCVKTIKSSYLLGAYEETVISTFSNTTTPVPRWISIPEWNISAFDQYYPENAHIDAPAPGLNTSRSDWGVSNNTMLTTLDAFDRFFPAFTTTRNGSDPVLRWRTGHPTEVRTRRKIPNLWLPPNNVAEHLSHMVTALTNVLRSSAGSYEFVAGDAFIEETYVDVRWPWLTFPLIMLALSIMFLVATIQRTTKATNDEIGSWKTSAMPTLLYGLPQDMRKDFDSASGCCAKDKNACKRMKIRLLPDKGWRLSGLRSPKMAEKAQIRPPPGWL